MIERRQRASEEQRILKELVAAMTELDRAKANVLMQVNQCSWQEAVLEIMTRRNESASSPWRVAFRSTFGHSQPK